MDLKPSTTIDEQLVLIEGKGTHINDMQAARGFLRRRVKGQKELV